MAKSRSKTTTFARGLIPTPRHVLAAAAPFDPPRTLFAPTEFSVVPKQLSVWGNNKYGCCVTSQEAFSKAVWSMMCGLPQTFVTEAEVIRWASKHGVLNGAYLTGVMDIMARDGLRATDGKVWTDGPYKTVDYSNESVLQAAILQGPINVGLDADALPSTAGKANGWYATNGTPGQHRDENHCVALCGFGSAAYLYSQLGVSMPSGVSPGTPGYLLFTWGTIGFVTHNWIMSTFAEAWVRNPTTPGQLPGPTPNPGPTPEPGPLPPPTPQPPPFVLPELFVTIPAQRVLVPAGMGRSAYVTIPGQTVQVQESRGFKEPMQAVPWGKLFDLVVKLLPLLLKGEGHLEAAAELGITPEQWKKLFDIVVKLLPLLLAETAE